MFSNLFGSGSSESKEVVKKKMENTMITPTVVEAAENHKTFMLNASLEEVGSVGPVGTIQEKCKDRFNLNHQEAWSAKDKEVLMGPRYGSEHGFVTAVRTAYNNHIPLAFSPDHLWNVIIQGVSEHIGQNAEELRSKFVNFDGKEKLVIYRDHFVKGSETNDWAGCFQEWTEQIEGFVGEENKENLCPTFSTTTHLEMACTNLGFMDAMKSYFSYECRTSCGIKAVKLFGKEEDWDHLLENVQKLRQYDLDWWIDYIEPIVENICKTYKGEEINSLFWESIYKHHDSNGSGTVPTVDGWIVNFFPYVASYKNANKNPDLSTLEQIYERSLNPPQQRSFRQGPGMKEGKIPDGIAKTPFDWIYYGAKIPMEFHSGFIGAEILEDTEIGRFIQPVQFWAVAQKKEDDGDALEDPYGFN